MMTEAELAGCLRHTTEILEEWSRYHASEMTCDIAAALHNARAALAGSPDPGQRAEPAAWMHPTAGWARESYDKVRMHCMNDGPMPIPLYRGAPAPAQQVGMHLTLTRALGSYGAAYDPPGPHRAYTYEYPPTNGVAWNLGCAVSALRQYTQGDAIDTGLYLLREMQRRGLGVFETEPKVVADTPKDRAVVPGSSEESS